MKLKELSSILLADALVLEETETGVGRTILYEGYLQVAEGSILDRNIYLIQAIHAGQVRVLVHPEGRFLNG